MISLFLEGELEQAGKMLFENSPLSVVCSQICPHENFCEGHCILAKKSTPVHISSIEQFISNYYLARLDAQSCKVLSKEKIAIIGSGPAGLTVAFLLAANCYDVTIFESEDKIGGSLQHGIPDFRLAKGTLEKLKEALIKMGSRYDRIFSSVRLSPSMTCSPMPTVRSLSAPVSGTRDH